MSLAGRSSFVLALAIFYASGLAALLYQVVWQRLLVIFSGADIYSITVIVAAFMAGLGLGSLAGGQLADRVSARRSLWLFVGAELAVGLFGWFSKDFYYDLLYTRLSFLAASPAVGLVLFASLLWPTFFMGVSLPLLARGLTHRLAATGTVVGSLYGWNTLGAASGALIATWWLLPQFGLADTLRVGAAINVLSAAAAAALASAAPGVAGAETAASPEAAATGTAEGLGLSFGAWAAIYGLTGFTALGLEIAWFRVLGVMVKSTTFTFGTLLAIYLAGLGIGAALGAGRVARSRRPGFTFLALQTTMGLVAGLTLAGLTTLIESGRPPMLAAFLAEGEPYDVFPGVAAIRDLVRGQPGADLWRDASQFLLLHLVLPVALIGIPTMLMGLSFPYLQRATQADYSRIGRRVGILMAANIGGSALGATLTGLVLLSWLGAATTIKLLVIVGAIPAVLLVGQAERPRRAALLIALTAVAVVTVAVMPGSARLWAVLHGTSVENVLVAEDGSGLSVIKATQPGFEGQTIVFVNGASQGRIPFGDIHTALGAIPLLLHPGPAAVAIIGLGSGDTCFSAAGRPEVRTVACIEIIGAQRATLEQLAGITAVPALEALFSDRRIDYIVGDGRAYLRRANRRFDIIEADALRPVSAYSGNLYSREYFELMRQHLKPRGLAVTWAPTDRVRDTFVTVFPYVLALDNQQIYIGSNDPIVFDPEAIKRLAAAPRVRDHYRRAGVDILALVDERLSRDIVTFAPGDDRPGTDNLNSDLFPRDEYRLPELW